MISMKMIQAARTKQRRIKKWDTKSNKRTVPKKITDPQKMTMSH